LRAKIFTAKGIISADWWDQKILRKVGVENFQWAKLLEKSPPSTTGGKTVGREVVIRPMGRRQRKEVELRRRTLNKIESSRKSPPRLLIGKIQLNVY